MEDYADVYYVDTRNADARDHRTHGAAGGWRPSSGPANTVSSPSRTVIVNPPPMAAYPAGQYVRPMAYSNAGYPVYPGQPYPGQSALAGLFGNMPIGQILELVAVAFAALQPLPAAPQSTKETNTDVGNLILYQAALAAHAKRDEQVRTLGSLVSKLVG